MNAFTRFKEYFGMSPVAAYEDEYLDEYDRPPHHDRLHHDVPVGRDRRADYGYRDSYEDEIPVRRPRRAGVDHVAPADYRAADREPAALRADDRHAPVSARASLLDDEPAPRTRRYAAAEAGSHGARFGATRGAVALAPDEDDFADGLVTTPETVVERPRGFGDGKGLGENFRAGRAVVLDLSGMARDDARRMVDFAAGLVFGLDGSMKKVPERERTFLLQPAGMDLTEAEIRDAVSDAFRR